ncbi:ribosome assembly factor SBDS [Candidatus Nanohaloarchaea archaeon]|nr:ribosome assembly factor SBDS [Candidatus Nanohaloarchaea archaeon]
MDTSDAIKVRYEDYEILVDPDLAKEAKLEGKEHDIQRLLFVQEVFKDADQGERASADELENDFNTRQVMEAAEEIFEKGEMQLTTEQKKEMREDKRKQIVNMIARRAMDPKTGNPHPPQRVENALEEAGFHVDAMEDVEEQFDDAIEQIRPIIPVSLDKKTVGIKIPNDKAGKAYDLLKRKADLKDEQWGNEYFMARIQLPAGALTELMEELQEMTGGEVQMTEEA